MNRIITALVVALGAIGLIAGVATAAPRTAATTLPSMAEQQAILKDLPTGSFISATPPSAPAAATALKGYTKKNCWAGDRGNVETSNWGVDSTWQTYHVWVYKAPWYAGKVGHYMDGQFENLAPAEYYINTPDSPDSHRQGARAGTSLTSGYQWCAYYQ
jgi:hypothetical protein